MSDSRVLPLLPFQSRLPKRSMVRKENRYSRFRIHVHAKATLMPPFESLDLAGDAWICKTRLKSEECSCAHARGIPDTLGESRQRRAIVGSFDAAVLTGDGPFRFSFLLFP